MITLNEFSSRISNLTEIKSKTGNKTYSEIQVMGDMIHFKRNSTGNHRTLKVSELYKIYKKLDYIDTNTVKPFIEGWKYSPACAILIAIDLYSKTGFRI